MSGLAAAVELVPFPHCLLSEIGHPSPHPNNRALLDGPQL